ncbi:hypothetical protein F5Y16DRAFT_367168 [Xylariaceae sp. FL0255]|nr:hypothetical protein F5Y16DRAFT_367168 [Xylariaceae sp. FL0255]
MQSTDAISWWHEENVSGSHSPAKMAFQSVKEHFKSCNNRAKQDSLNLDDQTSVEDIQQLVTDALKKYANKYQSQKTRKWLHKASETICHYGEVLDVFVEHHPEYVALVWGTMKLLFTSVINHEETLRLLTKATTQIALRLPRMKALSQLYQTSQMRQALESLYSCILEFLLMAHNWCNESRIQHIVHSLTRPHELRYGELLRRITDCSENILELAALGSQAEIRTIRKVQESEMGDIFAALEAAEKSRANEIDCLLRAVTRMESSNRERDQKTDQIISFLQSSGLTIRDLAAKTEAFHAISTSAQLNTNQQLSDIQLSQALSALSLTCQDPEKSYRSHALMRRRRLAGMGSQISTSEFWTSPRLERLSRSQKSGMVVIKGNFATRLVMQDFVVDVISTLMHNKIPIIWGLSSLGKRKRAEAPPAAVDLIKSLTYQGPRLRSTLRTEKQLSIRYTQFHTSTTFQEWFALFQDVILSLPGSLIYLVVDLAAVPAEDARNANLLEHLPLLLDYIFSRPNSPTIKIILLAYEAHWYTAIPADTADFVIPVRIQGSKRGQGKTMRRAVMRRSFTATARGR